MSKEKTIGLSVLGGLMMTLAGTVAMRMSMARDDVASALRDAPDSVAETHAPYKPSKLLNRLAAEPMASPTTTSEERTPSRYEEPRALAEQPPQTVGDRYAMPAMAELAAVESTPNEPAQPVSATTPIEEPAADVARHSADPFHAASLGEPMPLAEPTPLHEHMPPQAAASEIMAPAASHMHSHEASPAHGLLAVESEPALQASHEGTHSGNVQHAVPSASNFIQSHTHAPPRNPHRIPTPRGTTATRGPRRRRTWARAMALRHRIRRLPTTTSTVATCLSRPIRRRLIISIRRPELTNRRINTRRSKTATSQNSSE